MGKRLGLVLLFAIAIPVFAEPERTVFMFVQTGNSGSFVPKADKPGEYVLSLTGVSPLTIYFSDRPLRLAGRIGTDEMVKGSMFDGANPPNAAVELQYGTDEADVIIGELRNPVYDAVKRTIRYDVKVLSDVTEGLAFYSARRDDKLPREFKEVAIFIDSCPDVVLDCLTTSTRCGRVTVPPDPRDARCTHRQINAADKCNAQFPQCCQGRCFSN